MSINQDHARLSLDPYLVAGFLPRAMPAAAALGKSLVSASTPSITGAITSQLDLDLGATCRWIADPAKIVDNGDGTVDWRTSQGSNRAPAWRFDASSQPIQDSAYTYERPDGSTAAFPAFIFNGGKWAQLVGMSNKPGWTVAIVLKLRRSPGPYSNIFASKVTWADGNTGDDSAVQYRPGWGVIRTIKRGYSRGDPVTLTDRPLIIVSRSGYLHTYQVLGDNNWSYVRFKHDPVTSYDMQWYLGRASDLYNNSLTLHADVLDIMLWDHAMDQPWKSRQIAYRLNHLYRVVP